MCGNISVCIVYPITVQSRLDLKKKRRESFVISNQIVYLILSFVLGIGCVGVSHGYVVVNSNDFAVSATTFLIFQVCLRAGSPVPRPTVQSSSARVARGTGWRRAGSPSTPATEGSSSSDRLAGSAARMEPGHPKGYRSVVGFHATPPLSLNHIPFHLSSQ